jgi:DNA modification methylase
MINRGWILRNEIIWHKPNCMPASVKDRFTIDFEYLFFFVKNKKYYFEQQFEPMVLNRWSLSNKIGSSNKNIKTGSGAPGQSPHSWERKGHSGYFDGEGNPLFDPEGRNKRCVWKVPPKPFPEAHFAVYPEELIETPIKAGCPKFICRKCGKAREKVYNPTGNYIVQGGYGSKTAEHIGASPTSSLLTKKVQEKQFVVYTTCNCNAGFESGIVLDPFMGSGTTALVALKQQKRFVGIELNPQYIEIAYKRIRPLMSQVKLTELAA